MAALNRQLPLPERGGRLMSHSNLHLTLHYIGFVSEESLACLSRALQKVSSAPFKMGLDRLGYFKRPKVLWLGCKETPTGYTELLKQLAEKIAHCGFEMEEETNRPHITLRRKVSRPKEVTNIQTIKWKVEQFVLVESVSSKRGVSYRVVESYPLMGVNNARST